MTNKIKCLDILAPESIERFIGYQGQAEWVEIHLEHEINQTICSDGKTDSPASPELWEIIIECLSSNQKVQGVYFSSQHCLLLNRHTRVLYTGDQSVIQRYLQQPDCLNLFAAFHQDIDTLPRANASKINKTKWTKSLVHVSNAKTRVFVNLIFSSVDGR